MGRGFQDARYLAVDLGGTNLRVALAEGSGRISSRLSEPTAVESGPGGIIARMAAMAQALLDQVGLHPSDIRRVGVATPGPIDGPRGAVLDPPNLPGWDDVPLVSMLREHLDVPVVLVNDANAAGLGEWAFGAGRGTRTMVYLTVSTGIGGGVVADGRLLEGWHSDAGEIGHTIIDPHGPRCGCGAPGCLEAFASGTSIARRFNELVRSGQDSSLAAQARAHPVTAAEVAGAAAGGDELARSVIHWASEALGIGVANCINIFNPEMVVLGGGVTRIGEPLFETVREVASAYALPALSAGVRIVPASLEDDAGLIGAAVLAAQDV